jgi:hypothetical protein
MLAAAAARWIAACRSCSSLSPDPVAAARSWLMAARRWASPALRNARVLAAIARSAAACEAATWRCAAASRSLGSLPGAPPWCSSSIRARIALIRCLISSRRLPSDSGSFPAALPLADRDSAATCLLARPDKAGTCASTGYPMFLSSSGTAASRLTPPYPSPLWRQLCAEQEPPLRPFSADGIRAACHFPLREPLAETEHLPGGHGQLHTAAGRQRTAGRGKAPELPGDQLAATSTTPIACSLASGHSRADPGFARSGDGQRRSPHGGVNDGQRGHGIDTATE